MRDLTTIPSECWLFEGDMAQCQLHMPYARQMARRAWLAGQNTCQEYTADRYIRVELSGGMARIIIRAGASIVLIHIADAMFTGIGGNYAFNQVWETPGGTGTRRHFVRTFSHREEIAKMITTPTDYEIRMNGVLLALDGQTAEQIWWRGNWRLHIYDQFYISLQFIEATVNDPEKETGFNIEGQRVKGTVFNIEVRSSLDSWSEMPNKVSLEIKKKGAPLVTALLNYGAKLHIQYVIGLRPLLEFNLSTYAFKRTDEIDGAEFKVEAVSTETYKALR